MTRRVNVGLIGHRFMGKAHSHALRDIAMFFPLEAVPVMKVLCGIGEDLEATAEKYGWETFSNSWRDVVDNPDIDVIDIATPGMTHCEIALAAAGRGKHILCEKPLAMTLAEARRMWEAAEKSKVKHMVNFNYRRLPAVDLARSLIEDGKLGRIYHVRATYQQDWPLDPEFPFLWRMDKSAAGAGSMADKGSHVVDLARHLVGEFDEVAATTEIFIRERPLADRPGIKKQVTTDDAAVWVARFTNGALGVFETSRISAGRKNALCFEVNGSLGSLLFDLERLNELKVYFAQDEPEVQGFRTIIVTQPCHRYISQWWPPGHIIGWEHTFIHQYYEFLKAISEDYQPSPNFHDGVKNHEVLDAIDTASQERRWVKVGA